MTDALVTQQPVRHRTPAAAKVPEITAMSYVIKVLTTGMGEATSDFLVKGNGVVARGLGLLGSAVAMALQVRARGYRAGAYWFAVAMVSVFGTMAAFRLACRPRLVSCRCGER